MGRMQYALLAFFCVLAASAAPPNVVLIMTDDQGYGDLACHGNPILKTPNLDALHAESVRLTDFHTMPFCTPTRAALMTGRNASRTGAYRTSAGRTMMHPDEVSMATVFRDNAYATGIFGKWHLGDNYPHRPQDRGFETTRWHRCGGVGQGSDYWGNDYFDDTYEENGRFKKFEGYCTDVFFEGARDFIAASAAAKKPFFAYIATNAPHGPYRVPPEYAAPYKESADWGAAANFFGMIANIDENVGRLRQQLNALKIADNTIFIFMTDNGTAAGVAPGKEEGYGRLDQLAVKGHNAGMRGKKSSIYDGGHRVPFFLHWPTGNFTEGRDVPQLAACWDVLPTLIDLCELTPPTIDFDGHSLVPALRGDAMPERTLVMQFQGGAYFRHLPMPWTDSVVMSKRWRLLNGKQLYDMEADPSQSNDVAEENPDVVERLRAVYEPWWESVSPRLSPVYIGVGNPAEPLTVLCSQDWYMPVGNPPWNVPSIKKLPAVTAPWNIDIERAGEYSVALRQTPREAGAAVVGARMRVQIAGQVAVAPIPENAHSLYLTMRLRAGRTQVKTAITQADGKVGGAYFVEMKRLRD
jgi:arylsulfatase A-like enzyme